MPVDPLKVEMPPDGELEVAMVEERLYEGLVVDGRDDAPIEGAKVRLAVHMDIALAGSLTYGRTLRSAGRAETASDGSFLIDGLGAGEHELHVSADGMRPLQKNIVIAAAAVDPVVIRLDPGFTLRGRVENADGEPVAGVRVGASPASQSMDDPQASYSGTESDAEGRFELDGLESGLQRVFARSEESGQTAHATAEAGQADHVVLRFPRGAAISGIVVNPEGTPVGDADVWGSGGTTRQLSLIHI